MTHLSFSLFQPKEDSKISSLESRLTETDKKIEDIYHQVSVIQFLIDSQEQTIKDLETSLKNKKSEGIEKKEILYPPVNKGSNKIESKIQNVPERPENTYKRAFSAYKNKNYEQAASLFKYFTSTHPDHDLADNALYWTGECFYTRKKFDKAIITFKEVLKKYPEGDKVPDSLLKIGYAYFSLEDFENARFFLKKVTKAYPLYPAGSRAKKMLKRLK